MSKIGLKINQMYINRRTKFSALKGRPQAKWLRFAQTMIDNGYEVRVHEAQTTVSKYVYVIHPQGKKFKVRFSNHKPNARQEHIEDSDYYVGITNTGGRNTSDAIGATFKFFRGMATPSEYNHLKQVQVFGDLDA